MQMANTLVVGGPVMAAEEKMKKGERKNGENCIKKRGKKYECLAILIIYIFDAIDILTMNQFLYTDIN